MYNKIWANGQNQIVYEDQILYEGCAFDNILLQLCTFWACAHTTFNHKKGRVKYGTQGLDLRV